ncbi:MAG: heme o synthase [Alphaproteobacteria bacterium]|jgi:protoheme IX farnesyltransferase|nr:heme o synthase [Alphaproteobacteria bacterium]
MNGAPDIMSVPAASDDRISDYFLLLKPKVMSLVVFTGFAGMWIAPGFHQLHPFLAFIAMLCLAVGAGAAGAINMWFDRDIDAVMHRTRFRPLPMGRVRPEEALSFGIILSLASVVMMGLALNWLAAALLAAANLFYVFIYTIWLKRLTPQNIVIGGAAGAFPPMIGWAAVTGDITMYPVILFLIIFFWTPPHFWALSLFANEDYKRADIPMMTVVAGERRTKIQMLAYTLILLPVTLSPYFLGFENFNYLIAASVLSGFFVFTAIRVLSSTSLKNAKLMFGYSVFYLFALFLAVMVL